MQMIKTAVSGGALSPFEKYADSDVRLLIESCPLAWVCAGGEASLLPLVGVFDSEDRLVELIGHFSRANPLGAALTKVPQATILFTGPAGYVSPSQAGRRDWAPTWNYAQLRIEAEVDVSAEMTAQALDILIEKMEAGRPEPWRAAELGERYEKLLPKIIGFRARPTAVAAKFKLGQDERPETLRAILSNMQDDELAAWMKRFNQQRLGD